VIGPPRFDADGLVPAVVQDAGTGVVLMLAYMNIVAWQRTLQTRQAWFWSRSRGELWEKGATSGNRMTVVEVRLDCDDDSVLLRVEPTGPACHTGQTSCFFTVVEEDG
jgi:phosphoribosyl-AMP cyclohydrolase